MTPFHPLHLSEGDPIRVYIPRVLNSDLIYTGAPCSITQAHSVCSLELTQCQGEEWPTWYVSLIFLSTRGIHPPSCCSVASPHSRSTVPGPPQLWWFFCHLRAWEYLMTCQWLVPLDRPTANRSLGFPVWGSASGKQAKSPLPLGLMHTLMVSCPQHSCKQSPSPCLQGALRSLFSLLLLSPSFPLIPLWIIPSPGRHSLCQDHLLPQAGPQEPNPEPYVWLLLLLLCYSCAPWGQLSSWTW